MEQAWAGLASEILDQLAGAQSGSLARERPLLWPHALASAETLMSAMIGWASEEPKHGSTRKTYARDPEWRRRSSLAGPPMGCMEPPACVGAGEYLAKTVQDPAAIPASHPK